VEEGDLAADRRTAAAPGGWIVFEDECGQSMRPPRSPTWGGDHHAMDEHFRTAPLARNLPVIMSLLVVWYVNFFGGRRRG
jgi:Phosphoglucose isomerase